MILWDSQSWLSAFRSVVARPYRIAGVRALSSAAARHGASQNPSR